VAIVFKHLQKLVSHSQHGENTSKELFQRLQGKPFWIWNIDEHKQEDIRTNGDCCFNHIIGLPQRNEMDKPLYHYEGIIFDPLVTQNSNNVPIVTGKLPFLNSTVIFTSYDDFSSIVSWP
jgi:hypothetical protein